MSEFQKTIEIPSDNDGFCILQCSLCGDFFKLKPNEVQADDIIDIYCPSCGLISQNYFTIEVITLAKNIAQNYAINLIFDNFKTLGKKNKNNIFSFKLSSKPKSKSENPLLPGIEALDIISYKCCKKQAKINPLTKLSGGFCPYCGVNYDEFK